MMQIASLSDLGYIGSKYTWSSNRLRGSAIAERLDRAMGNTEWFAKYFTKVEYLNRCCSDHAPLLLSLSSISGQGSAFRFINAWAAHPQFMDIIKEGWATPCERRPMMQFANKLKATK